MKNLILLITVMVLSACASMPTVKSVAGTYERIEGGDTHRAVLLENGIVEGYVDGEKRGEEVKWELTKKGKIHVTTPFEEVGVCRINKDGSITWIADEFEGERKEVPKEHQKTWKKIK